MVVPSDKCGGFVVETMEPLKGVHKKNFGHAVMYKEVEKLDVKENWRYAE